MTSFEIDSHYTVSSGFFSEALRFVYFLHQSSAKWKGVNNINKTGKRGVCFLGALGNGPSRQRNGREKDFLCSGTRYLGNWIFFVSVIQPNPFSPVLLCPQKLFMSLDAFRVISGRGFTCQFGAEYNKIGFCKLCLLQYIKLVLFTL